MSPYDDLEAGTGELDEEVRRALEPTADEVERMVRGALASPSGGPGSARLLAAAAALVGAAGLYLWLGGSPGTGSGEEGAAPVAALTNVGEVVTVRRADGASWLLRSAPSKRGGAPSYFIAYPGEDP
jgi:hypothetical protein